jgi:hypothetical protein
MQSKDTSTREDETREEYRSMLRNEWEGTYSDYNTHVNNIYSFFQKVGDKFDRDHKHKKDLIVIRDLLPEFFLDGFLN